MTLWTWLGGVGTPFALAWMFAPQWLESPGSKPVASATQSPVATEVAVQSPSTPATASSPTPSPTLQYAVKVEDATWCVAGMMGNEPHCATGFAIDPTLIGRSSSEGVFLVTNHHVVDASAAGPNPMVSYQGKAKEGGEEFGKGEAIMQDPQRDLAVVFVAGATSPIAKLADSLPQRPGQWIKAVGFPANRPLTIKESEFLGMGTTGGRTGECLATPPCIKMRQSTTTHGNSGGPLVAKEAELGGSPSDPNQEVVIGVNEGETTDEVAIPIDQVKAFLSGGSAPDGRGSGRGPEGMPPEMGGRGPGGMPPPRF